MTELSGNDLAIAQDLKDSMTRAGIARGFHDTRLDEVEYGRQFKEKMLDGTVAAEIVRGVGWTVLGTKPEAYDLFVTMARAMLLTGVGVVVTSPDRLLRFVEERYYEPWDEAESIPVLFLSRFVQATECPFTRWQRVRVERLLEDRLDAKMPTYFQIARPMAEWWSGEVVARIVKLNSVMDVK